MFVYTGCAKERTSGRVNPERLAELQRQRDLIRAHLAWLEREIAAATPNAAFPGTASQPSPATAENLVSPGSADPGAAATGLAPPEEFAAKLATETAVEHYRPDPRSAALAARRGCALAFVGALLLLGLTLTAIYFLRYRDRPLFFPSEANPPAENLAPPSEPPRPPK